MRSTYFKRLARLEERVQFIENKETYLTEEGMPIEGSMSKDFAPRGLPETE